MPFLPNLFNKEGSGTFNRAAFRVLTWLIVFMGVMVALNFLFPQVVGVVLNVIWILLLVIVAIFFSLGILVIIGLRKEAQRILDFLIEGSLTLVDFIEFIKLLWKRFIEVLKEFALYATPAVAYVFGFILYILIMRLYKTVGITSDITLFTIILTAIMVFVTGILTRPSNDPVDYSKWWNKVKKSFHDAFVDAFEVILFVFFLTMDSTHLFFLPEHLNVLLHAQIGGYDLMLRSIVVDSHLKFTINIIIATISLEILRNLLKVIAQARKHYASDLMLFQDGRIIATKGTRTKNALRKAFHDAKDDLVKFITFNTVLFAVFLLFPRLKLLTLLVASVTSLLLDILITERLFTTRGNDLISRVLGKIFKL
jgi:hypothetical protein